MPTSLAIVRKFFPNVSKVTDSETPIRINVTKKDSQSSTVKNHKACAMAVACKRQLHLDGVVISVNRAYLIKGNEAVRCQIPPSVAREVVSFDRNAGFAEGQYQLSVPGKSGKRPPKRQRSPREDNNFKARFSHMTEGIRSALGSKNAT